MPVNLAVTMATMILQTAVGQIGEFVAWLEEHALHWVSSLCFS
jgi:hypothetical protein